jgi:hypothetical protein
MVNIKELSHERFNAFVDWTRGPLTGDFLQELEWYSDESEHVLGILTLDLMDDDFGFIILGRDENGRFRAIDLEHSLSDIDHARRRLKEVLHDHSQTGETVFPQDDELKSGVDLFTPLIPEHRWHSTFKTMIDYPHWQPAMGIMSEMMLHFIDVDGHFVKEFQSNGFDARCWELYLYAYFKEEQLFLDREYHAPDFMIGKYGQKVAIEAVTINPTENQKPPLRSEGDLYFRTDEEIKELLKNHVPIKFSGALTGKLKKKPAYWELEHVNGLPVVFALADFHEPQSITWTFPAILEYLYGITQEYSYDETGQLIINPLKVESYTKENGSQIQAGFFFLPEAENVAAVLFSNSGTLSKFNRMGRLAGFGIDECIMYRSGVCHNHDPNAALPLPFLIEIAPGRATETWAEGLSMFHNPKAKHPVPRELFPSIAHHEFRDGQIYSLIPDFHPYTSVTIHLLPEDKVKTWAETGGKYPPQKTN